MRHRSCADARCRSLARSDVFPSLDCRPFLGSTEAHSGCNNQITIAILQRKPVHAGWVSGLLRERAVRIARYLYAEFVVKPVSAIDLDFDRSGFDQGPSARPAATGINPLGPKMLDDKLPARKGPQCSTTSAIQPMSEPHLDAHL